MSSICLIDTTIFLNLLNVPHCTQHKKLVEKDYKLYVNADCELMLPMATVIETGNHIAQNGDGRVRRNTAIRFVENIIAACNDEAPWSLAEFPDKKEILLWIHKFPDEAGKNKSPSKPEGTSFGDLSIIEEFHKLCKKYSMSEVFIWSLDSDLKNYHQPPKS